MSNLEEKLKEYGLENKKMVNKNGRIYECSVCGHTFLSFVFSDIASCPKCNELLYVWYNE